MRRLRNLSALAVAGIVSWSGALFAQSASADRCSAALVVTGDYNITNIAVACGLPREVVEVLIQHATAPFRSQIDELKQKVAKDDRFQEDLNQRLLAQQQETQALIARGKTVERALPFIEEGERRREAEEALRKGQIELAEMYVAQYVRYERETWGDDKSYLSFNAFQMSDRPGGILGGGAGFGWEAFKKLRRWRTGSVNLVAEPDLFVGSAHIGSRNSFVFGVTGDLLGRVRLQGIGGTSFIMTFGTELPLLQYYGVDKKFRCPLIGGVAGLGFMVTPKWGFDIRYRYQLDQLFFPSRANMQTLQIGMQFTWWDAWKSDRPATVEEKAALEKKLEEHREAEEARCARDFRNGQQGLYCRDGRRMTELEEHQDYGAFLRGECAKEGDRHAFIEGEWCSRLDEFEFEERQEREEREDLRR